MMSTAWINTMLLETFGRDYLERGELRTKYIKTTDVGITIRIFGKVYRADRAGGSASGSCSMSGLRIWPA